MEYITSRRSSKLSNEPYEISYLDIAQMYRENLRDAEECRRVTESSMRGESYYYGDGRPGTGKIKDGRAAFYKEVLYRDAKTSGFMMQYPHGTVIRQAERNSYYRGENRIYPKSQPSIFRSLEQLANEEDKQLYQMICDMRIAEFGDFLCRFGIVQFWINNYGTVLFEPLAQHYGLETEWLDVTNDFNVALFFATCKWDGKRWLPLLKEDTEVDESTRYGVIFHAPSWQVNFQRMQMGLETADGIKYLHNIVIPIGFQPFMRCHSQYAYGIHMEEPFPLQEDFTFEKLYFRHSEKLSKAVYDLMDGGKKIYPQEGLDDFKDVIHDIKNASQFSEEAFRYAFNKNKYFDNETETRNKLCKKEIFGRNILIEKDLHPYRISRQRIRHLNMKYDGFSIEKMYGIKLITRKVLYR